MKQAEVKDLSTADLTERINSEKATLVKLKMTHAVSPVENPLRIKTTRRTIARLSTELRARANEKSNK